MGHSTSSEGKGGSVEYDSGTVTEKRKKKKGWRGE